jgi:uncharacterized YccA/Bax inhibitor family protein
MTTSNPTLGAFTNVGALGASYGDSATMTVDGTIHKTGILAALLALAFGFTWVGLGHAEIPSVIPIFVAGFGGFILVMIICFKPTTAPYLSPVYALAEGFFLAAISYPLNQIYPLIVLQAATLSIATIFGMLLAYRTGLIKVNNTFRAVIIGATMTIFLYYMIGWIASLFFGVLLPGIGLQGSWLSIGISGVIVVIAAMNLALDFDQIASNAGTAPRYMEWYGAFGLMVTIIWLYFEILRLLAQLRGRNQ